MWESAWGKFPRARPPAQVVLLGEQPQVIAHLLHSVQQSLRLLAFALPGQVLDHPEAADEENPFLPRQAVVGLMRTVAVNEPLVAELAADRLDGGDDPRIVIRKKAENRDQQAAGIEGVGLVVLDEGLLLLVPPLLQHFPADLLPRLVPAIQVGGKTVAAGDGDPPVEGHPAHHLGVDEMPGAAAHLPDAAVLLAPVLANGVADVRQQGPDLQVDFADVAGQLEGGVHDLAVNVQLPLLDGGVADAHRPRPLVPFQMVEGLLLTDRLPLQVVQDLQPGAAFGDQLLDPAQEPLGFRQVPQVEEGFQGEGGIAHPGEAVIPVAHAAHLFRQRGGGGGGDGAGRPELQQLEQEGRALYVLAEGTKVQTKAGFRDGQPVMPEGLGRAQCPFPFFRLEGMAVAAVEFQVQPGEVPLAQLPAGQAALSLHAQPGAAAAQGQGMAAAAGEEAAFLLRQGGGGPAVIETGAEIDPHLHFPLGDLDHAVQLRPLRAVVFGRFFDDRHEVGEDHLPVPGAKGGGEDVGGFQVARRRIPLAGRADGKVAAAVFVENGREDAGGIEAGQTAPVDGAVPSDQGHRMEVADNAVIADILIHVRTLQLAAFIDTITSRADLSALPRRIFPVIMRTSGARFPEPGHGYSASD